jgi:hypothetical protein
MSLIRIFFVALFALNALFWGLYPHGTHCRFAAALGVSKCPSHWVHISFGVVSFIIAVVIAQWSFIRHMSR